MLTRYQKSIITRLRKVYDLELNDEDESSYFENRSYIFGETIKMGWILRDDLRTLKPGFIRISPRTDIGGDDWSEPIPIEQALRYIQLKVFT
jgi:hypothetical protein